MKVWITNQLLGFRITHIEPLTSTGSSKSQINYEGQKPKGINLTTKHNLIQQQLYTLLQTSNSMRI